MKTQLDFGRTSEYGFDGVIASDQVYGLGGEKFERRNLIGECLRSIHVTASVIFLTPMMFIARLMLELKTVRLISAPTFFRPRVKK